MLSQSMIQYIDKRIPESPFIKATSLSNFGNWPCDQSDLTGLNKKIFFSTVVAFSVYFMPLQVPLLYPRSPEGEGGILFYVCPSVFPSIQDIFRRIFLSNYRWQKSDIWTQASYRYAILWVAFFWTRQIPTSCLST